MKDHTHIIEETEATSMRVLVKYYSGDLHHFFLEQLGHAHTATTWAPPPSSQTPHGFLGSPWAPHTTPFPGPKPLVSMYPSTADYIQLLIDLAAQPEPNDHIFGQAIALLLHWSRLMGTGHMPLEDASLIQQALNRQATVPTLKGRWISVADKVVIRDDEELGKAFDAQPVHFLWLCKASESDIVRYSAHIMAASTSLCPLQHCLGIQ